MYKQQLDQGKLQDSLSSPMSVEKFKMGCTRSPSKEKLLELK